MLRPLWIRFFLALVLVAVQARAEGRPPNVLVIIADDQGWGDLSFHGNHNLATPNLDSLARDGAMFERFYVEPVCSPTRAEFLTGRYHGRVGVRGVSGGAERLNLDERTLADDFKAAGYATALFGKWHNGGQYPYHPNGRGFDEFHGYCQGHWGDYFSPPLDHNGRAVRGEGFLADDITDHAIVFMEANRSREFFCVLSFNTPHSPMQVPDRFWEKFKDTPLTMRGTGGDPEDLNHTRAALAMVENLDWNVGRALARIDELGLRGDTVVVYFSDNGPNGARWNGGMKGRKGTTDEGGVRSPLFVRWPGRVAAGTRVGQVAAAIDLAPTLAELAGARLAAPKPLDGRSLAPLLLGSASAEWPDRTIFSTWSGKFSARTQHYRFDAAGALYDMDADPGQTRDIAGERPDVAARLKNELAALRREVAPQSRDTRPFPVGYPEFPATRLCAGEGVPHGGVRRSSRSPNSSYFTNWKTVDDRVEWDIQLVTPGSYEVTLDYACPGSSVGSRFELAFGGATLEGRIDQANPAPERGAEHDRVPRAESYIKDFKPLRAGVIELKSGRGAFSLRALEIKGGELMELGGLTLTLMD